MSKIFGYGNKIWSIYIDKDNLDRYLGTIKEMYDEDDIDERIDVSKSFQMQNPISLTSDTIEMYSITIIATSGEIDKLSQKLGLIDCVH